MNKIKTQICLFCIAFTAFAQENNLSKIITYRKTIISPTYNLFLKNTENAATIEALNAIKNEFSEKISLPKVENNNSITAFNEKIWIANHKNIEVFNIKTGAKINVIDIPQNVSVNQMAIGYNDVIFLTDNQNHKIYAVENNNFNILIENEQITNTTALLQIASQIFISAEDKILVFSISKKTITTYAENLNGVLALETDHLMQIVALTKTEIIRFNISKEKQVLEINNGNFVSFSINPESKQLFLLDNQNKITAKDYLKLTNKNASVSKHSALRKMKPFEAKDIILVGSEYLIHSNNENPDLRETILEGFYPEKGKVENGELSAITPNKKTMECAEKSYQAFLKWSKKVSVKFKETTRKTPPTFWLMVNDYSQIKEKLQEGSREAKIWYWKRKPATMGRFPGFWKWEAVLTQDCKCVLPNEIEAEKYFETFIKENN